MTDHQYALPAGTLLACYRIQRLLGHGGFGLTYLADDTKLHRSVAIKELLPIDFAMRQQGQSTVVAKSQDDKENLLWSQQRFMEEGRNLASLNDPGILKIYDIFEQHRTAYLVTGFVEGGNLLDWWRANSQLDQENTLRVMLDSLLRSLSKVHARGLLHRDIKPHNILMETEGVQPVLIDFGNARGASQEKTRNVTAIVTVGYSPIEQYSTQSRQGPYTDLYALGAVLYHLISGSKPCDSATRLDDDPLVPLGVLRPAGYSAHFLAGIDRAMAFKREARWQTAEAWLDDLHRVNPQLPPPLPEPPPLPDDRSAGPVVDTEKLGEALHAARQFVAARSLAVVTNFRSRAAKWGQRRPAAPPVASAPKPAPPSQGDELLATLPPPPEAIALDSAESPWADAEFATSALHPAIRRPGGWYMFVAVVLILLSLMFMLTGLTQLILEWNSLTFRDCAMLALFLGLGAATLTGGVRLIKLFGSIQSVLLTDAEDALILHLAHHRRLWDLTTAVLLLVALILLITTSISLLS